MIYPTFAVGDRVIVSNPLPEKSAALGSVGRVTQNVPLHGAPAHHVTLEPPQLPQVWLFYALELESVVVEEVPSAGALDEPPEPEKAPEPATEKRRKSRSSAPPGLSRGDKHRWHQERIAAELGISISEMMSRRALARRAKDEAGEPIARYTDEERRVRHAESQRAHVARKSDAIAPNVPVAPVAPIVRTAPVAPVVAGRGSEEWKAPVGEGVCARAANKTPGKRPVKTKSVRRVYRVDDCVLVKRGVSHVLWDEESCLFCDVVVQVAQIGDGTLRVIDPETPARGIAEGGGWWLPSTSVEPTT